MISMSALGRSKLYDFVQEQVKSMAFSANIDFIAFYRHKDRLVMRRVDRGERIPDVGYDKTEWVYYPKDRYKAWEIVRDAIRQLQPDSSVNHLYGLQYQLEGEDAPRLVCFEFYIPGVNHQVFSACDLVTPRYVRSFLFREGVD